MTTTSARATYDEHVYGQSLIVNAVEIEHWRRAAADLLRHWGAPDETVELVRLGVSELLSNVARHVDHPRCYLRITRIGTTVTVQVFDRSRRLPRVVTEPDWQAESGRGLWMLREMATGFGSELTERCAGKIVWFSCDLA
ncbi:ATP-binding protein [Streptomyces carpaticus]|uniref:ATP-binding protein n=1 Tax=Streptomyces carpaticus TaxID=285558 RepID=UPI0031F79BB1